MFDLSDLLDDEPAPDSIPPTVNTAQLAVLLGISAQRVRQLANEGVIIKAGRGLYDTRLAIKSYCERLRRTSARSNTDTPTGDELKTEKLRLVKEQADAAALKNEALRGELVPAADVEARWTTILTDLRAQMLAISGRIAGRLSLSPTDIAEIDSEIRLALSEAGRQQ